jgi:hypothetical protein
MKITFFLILFISLSASAAGFQGLFSAKEGKYQVELPNVSFSYTCSYVFLNVSRFNNTIRISTNFNCEDLEDQEFTALYLEVIQGKLYDKNIEVGSISEDELFLQVPDGRGFEIYSLKWESSGLRYFHQSSLYGNDFGSLETILKKF